MKRLDIVYLYPNEMNTYGDRGNVLALKRRAEWHGYIPVLHFQRLGDDLPTKVDIIVGGGGQDSAQEDIQRDVQRLKPALHRLAAEGTPMLMVCGTYQLFGHRYTTQEGEEISGIGIFDVETVAGSERAIGNVLATSDTFDMLVGFENHSGRTYLHSGQAPLAEVVRGQGNNGEDGTEGAITNNVIGTYLHGPVLPNNPKLADHLLRLAAEKRFGVFEMQPLPDTYAIMARSNAEKRNYY